jgi:hypothetical protein
MDDVGLESAVDYLALDDVAWLGLLAQYGDCVVGCDECVEGVDLAKSVSPIGKMRRSVYRTLPKVWQPHVLLYQSTRPSCQRRLLF